MFDCHRALAGSTFPVGPHDQLASTTAAVFRSWDSPKAATYRRLNHIDDKAGTAVTVQTMVFGNAGGQSGSGVDFSLQFGGLRGTSQLNTGPRRFKR